MSAVKDSFSLQSVEALRTMKLISFVIVSLTIFLPLVVSLYINLEVNELIGINIDE